MTAPQLEEFQLFIDGRSVPALSGRSFESQNPYLGRQTVAEWLPVITGHLANHRDQMTDVLRSRDRLPERFDRQAAAGAAG